MKTNRHYVLTAVTALICTLFFLSAAVVITLNFRPLYYHDMRQLNLSALSGLSEEEIRENYDALIEYNSMFYQGDLEFPSLSMSESGRIHFEEVKQIFVWVQYLCILSFLGGVALIFFHWRKKAGWLFLKAAALLCITLPLLLGSLIALNWDQFFVTFHHLFFDNDYWIFDPALDPVITILPDAFFLHCALMILALVVSFSALCTLLYHMLKKKCGRISLDSKHGI